MGPIPTLLVSLQAAQVKTEAHRESAVTGGREMGSRCQLRNAEDTADAQKLARGKGGLPCGSQGKNDPS